MQVTVPISVGELLDKITILEIKAERIADPEKRRNIDRELSELSARRDALGLGETAAAPLAPYLAPPPHSAPSPAIARDGRPLVGLNWAGNPVNRADARRSLALDRLRPLLAERGIRFVSLQFGPSAADIAKAGLEDRRETPALGDFAASASLVASLDLVVTVDTAMAHLAGAIAKEAWVLLAYAPDWRWGMSGETTSWYPSLRLFRQASPGDWDGVVAKLAQALGERFPGAAGAG